MAEKPKEQEKQQAKPVKKVEKSEKAEKPNRNPHLKEENEILVRVMGYDIPGSRNLYAGLTRIKGISWTISNAACLRLGLSKNKKVSDLSKADIQKNR